MKKTFNERCYKILKKVPRGKVTTYKALAEALGTKAYRAVGNAMKNNKMPDEIPCFKVIKSDGSIGGYMGNNPKNIKIKIKRLEAEGIIIKEGKIDLIRYSYNFNN